MFCFSLTEDMEARKPYRLPPEGRSQMTRKQKTQLLQLREEGLGYVKIGKILGVSKDTVRSFCRRNEPGACKETCKQCGKALRAFPGRKPRKFCSDRCRQKWWNAHLDEVKRKAIYSFTCQNCGKPFTAYGNKARKYCSHACYIAKRYGSNGNSHEN